MSKKSTLPKAEKSEKSEKTTSTKKVKVASAAATKTAEATKTKAVTEKSKVASEKNKAADKADSKNKATQEKKLDVVEQARKELAKMEANSKNNNGNWKQFPWGVFCGAVLLTLAAGLIVFKIMDMVRTSTIQAKLPKIIEPLGGGMPLKEIGKPKSQNGVYSFTIEFEDYDEVFTSYITRDGKMLFVDGYNVDELLSQYDESNDSSKAAITSCENMPKSERPVLDVYVSSDCGYCKQAEIQMAKAVEENPALGEQIVLHYAGSVGSDGQIISFLGSEEAGTENLRQVCIRDEQHDVFWPYVSCMANDGESDTCLAQAKVNTANVNACMESNDRGIAAITVDINRANELKVTGTPSFFLNDTDAVSDTSFGNGDRVPEAYKNIVCCASTTKPDFCGDAATTAE